MATLTRTDAGHAARGPLRIEVCRWVRPADGAKLVLRGDGRLRVWLPRLRKWWTLQADCSYPRAVEVAREGRYTKRVGGPAGTTGRVCAIPPAADPTRIVLASTPLAPPGQSRPPAEHEAAIRRHEKRVAAVVARMRPVTTRCFGCNRVGRCQSGKVFAARGGRSRWVGVGANCIREVVCPTCFRRWGWW